MPRYTSTVVVKWNNGTQEAENKEEYIRWIKAAWLEDYSINLSDNHIHKIRKEKEDE
mgnify:CR=1 FL=1